MANRLFMADPHTDRIPTRVLLILEFLLVSVGAVALFSGSWYFARAVFEDPFRIWRRQILWIIFGLILVLFIRRTPREFIKRSVPFLVWTTLIMNLLTYVPGISHSSGGARRWIEVMGLTFQPSELTRVVLILYLARMLEKNQRRLHNFRDGILPSVVVVFILAMSIYFQNDYSTAIFLMLLAVGMFFIAGVPRLVMGSFGVTATIASVIMLIMKPYRLVRLQAWFRPYADPFGAGYQILKARKALEHGGFWGQGLGRGTVKLGGLPAAHSDFIMAVIGEEVGLLGVSLILLLFTFFALMGWKTSLNAQDAFSRWAIFGLVSVIYWQVLVNLSVVSGLLPATGIPLPLFSAGGSATLMTIIMFGLIHRLGETN